MPVTINGDGTITGYTPPIADGSITSAKLANGAVGTNQLANGAATQAKRTYASGEVIQVKTDTYDSNYIDLATAANQQLGANLEVSITFSSTSNFYIASCFIPDIYNMGYQGDRALHGGFAYSTTNWSSSEILNVHPISDYMGWGQNELNEATWWTSGNCPSTSALKIRPRLQCVNGSMRIFANNMGVAQLTVMEIKG